ncbi:MAG: hypothetical protein K1X72_01245 [Pyrinomonadaceae bacterium]|nr:hypothetical protein [Pyrinomonadaceae bacterium]
MISVEKIKDILSLYAKFGWKLERVLLTSKLRKQLGDSIKELFDSIEVIESDINAVWFTRASGKDRTAWELRRLSETPYALCEVFENSTDESDCEEKRHEMMMQLKTKN